MLPPKLLWPLVLAALPCAMALSPQTSRGCSMAPEEGVGVLPAWESVIHRDGVLVLDLTDYDGDAADAQFSISVTRDGAPVPGVLELRVPDGQSGTAIAVWRPDQPFVPGPHEVELVTSLDGLNDQSSVSAFEVLDMDAGLLEPDALRVDLELSALAAGVGRELCCDQQFDACGVTRAIESCVFETSEYQIQVAGAAGIPESHRPYVQISVSGTPVSSFSGIGLWTQVSSYGVAPTIAAVITESAEQYCVQVEATNLIDGVVTTSEACVDHRELEDRRIDNDLDAFAAQCDSPAVFTDNGERYEDEAGCRVGGSAPVGGLVMLAMFGLLRRRR